MKLLRPLIVLALPALSQALCPMIGGQGGGALPAHHPPVPGVTPARAPVRKAYQEAVKTISFKEVAADLKALYRDSKEWWPADYGHYGPFFIRLAWHCSGSYRSSDGRGGCEGGRQRFDPERSWDDNTNLDKARALLWPIKQKYGLGLSWGDLFVLAGTTAIEDMGGPVLGFCGGRVDDEDGAWSQELGPTPEQEEFAPCAVNGQCKPPLGTTTVGLIYLNPEGPMGQPIPEKSAGEVRDAFGRMNMNDTETVALIGGGHTFGKTHGACPNGPGPKPKDDPSNPWPGECGTGKGADAFTSGFEGPWTTTPTAWSNQYFQFLVDYEWEVHTGPGGHNQWRVKNGTNPVAPGPAGGSQDTIMLTSDISLTKDPSGRFQPIVKEFAANPQAFGDAFAHAWYKLTTRDTGPVTRCVGDNVPPPQPWQYPLPPTPAKLANFTQVAVEIRKAIVTSQSAVLPPDVYDGRPSYGPLFVRLASSCFGTFRITDHLGGCNGARIRYSPEKDWPANAALDAALNLLAPIKTRHGSGLSWADLIILAGTVAVEEAGGREMSFCGGRTDASDGLGSQFLAPTISGSVNDDVYRVRQAMKLMDLTAKEYVALAGGGHSLGQMHAKRSGFEGAWTADPTTLDNTYFKTLLNEVWQPYTSSAGQAQFKAVGKEIYALQTDLIFRWDPEFASIAMDFASDNDYFLDSFAAAWTKMANADRFDGPTGNVCA